MHVFIDTNILLNFFHFSKDDLDILNTVLVSHEHGSATVHLTQQLYDEFTRNRENKIKDALKRFNDTKIAIQLPSFMKDYEEAAQIKKLSKELKQAMDAIQARAHLQIRSRDLFADRLIGNIFETSGISEIGDVAYKQAFRRVALGNPPGKDGSLGDAVNWVLLLESVPKGEDIHVISADGDFFSILDEDQANTFLEDEWKRRKSGTLYTYRTLSAFTGKHFDGVAFSFDKNKKALIDSLAESGSFERTHSLIASLEDYSYFSLKEVERILTAAAENDQFGRIVTDYDISDFLNRVAVPRAGSITNEDHRQVLHDVREEKAERNE